MAAHQTMFMMGMSWLQFTMAGVTPWPSTIPSGMDRESSEVAT